MGRFFFFLKKPSSPLVKEEPWVRPLLHIPGSFHGTRQAAELGHLPSAVSRHWELQPLNRASGQDKRRTAKLWSMTNATRKDQNWLPQWTVLAEKRREGLSGLLQWDHYY